jgi:hypothetical protein
MGGKHTGPRKHIYICIAFLVCSVISGCVSSGENMGTQTTQKGISRWRFLKADDSQKDPENPLSRESISLNDEGLFNTGISLSDPGSTTKDYNKAITTFKRLIAEYPKSTWAYRGHVVSEILQENAKLKKQGTDLMQENGKLKKQGTDLMQENGKLREIIEQSKKVDIEIGQKKRE